MHNVPDTVEILRTVRDFLRDELLPTLDGAPAYRTRVAVNLLEILEREHTLGPVHAAREVELLGDLLGMHADVATLNRELCHRLDTTDPSDESLDGAALHALRAIAADKLAIARPGYGDGV